MPTSWALQDAKNRFSQVVDRALAEGSQTITRRGRDTAVLMSVSSFRELHGARGDLVRFLRESPLGQEDLDLTRDRDAGREVEL